ncbi:DUF1579 domain-containing protein [Rhodopirellula baltica]|jgi:hypothetical protein|uniref:DUF1579 domain-containing protein n=2 Tax=Rhodopirellula baltica TaxID=265606 RepID=Q7UYI9_RHOBA|nr:DUF1579 domain-containing protein [Rhodopirellula baltica]EGF24970.1 protein containing DUF1579 [Rhodopirellula baltica WH47]CAD71653.1 hypothetical protein RB562 [Rhodopirellula baltica SH 1]HBE63321.1 DUF1579 domain-containing protein [Rhodopirellula baltica]
MFAKPQSEHQWLEQILGEWKFDHDCKMPDGSNSTTHGKMSCRSLGGMWVICESGGESAEGEPWSSIMTLGFDTAEGRYVGTFVGSMMSNIWPYEGCLDESGKKLLLSSRGPAFDGSGKANYRDTIHIMDADTWMMTSELQDENGQWIEFMSGKHTRC